MRVAEEWGAPASGFGAERSVRRDGDEREQGRQQDVADDDEGERDHGTASCESAAECACSSDQRTTSDPGVNRP